MNKRFFPLMIVVLITLLITLNSLSAQNQTDSNLLEAIASGNIQQLQTSISGGTNINTPLNQLGWTALHAAVEFRQRGILIWLLQNQADVNIKDASGQTPLYLAVQTGQMDTVNTLIENHAEVNITANNGENAFSLAQKIGLSSIVSNLSEHGASLPSSPQGNRRGMPPGGNTMPGRRGGPRGNVTDQAPPNPVQPASIDIPGVQTEPAVVGEINLDPNEVKARLKNYEGLEKEVEGVADDSRISMRQWRRTEEDNRQPLISAIRRQFEAEVDLIKKIADEEKAQKTSEAAGNLITTRKDRLAKVTKEVRDQINQRDRQNRSTNISSRRGSRTTTRGRRSTIVEPQPNTNMPAENTQEQENKYDPETQSEVDTWLNADVETITGRISLMKTTNDMVISEINSLRPIATAENAQKTIAAIDGLLSARQQRIIEMETELNQTMQEQQTTGTQNMSEQWPTQNTPSGRGTMTGRRGR